MTPDRNDEMPLEPDEHGVLADTSSIDTTGIGIIDGATAQVSVVLPPVGEDDLDDDVVDDGVPLEAVVALMENPTARSWDDDPRERETDDAEIEVVSADDVVIEPLHDDGGSPDDGGSSDDGDIVDAVALDEAEGHGEPERHGGEPERHDGEPERHDGEDAAAARADAGIDEPADAHVEAEAPADEAAVAEAPAAEDPGNEGEAPAAPRPAGPVDEPAAEEGIVDRSNEQEIVASGAQPGRGTTPPPTRREAHHTGAVDRVHETERVHTPRPELALTSKRLGEFEPDRESPDLLTADRLLDHRQISGPEPEGAWRHFVYSLSGGRINLGDGKRARERKALDRRIAAPLSGGARFVPVLSRKGGVGKTTITTLLGMALADARDDRVIAIDANPDRGTLAERIARPSGRTVRDLVRTRDDVNGYNDISTIVARDQTRLDVLASDADPRVSEAFSDLDYEDVAAIAAHYYSIVLTDTGTGIVHSVMGATLGLADGLVVVSGLSVDEARLASETLTWLETNGYAEQVRSAVVVLNTARPGAPLVRQDELEAHFRTRVRAVVRMPYDPHIATGSAITFRELQPATRRAARELAARVVEGLRAMAAAA